MVSQNPYSTLQNLAQSGQIPLVSKLHLLHNSLGFCSSVLEYAKSLPTQSHLLMLFLLLGIFLLSSFMSCIPSPKPN